MMTFAALLLLSAGIGAPQEATVQPAVQRELRIHALGALAGQRRLGLKETQSRTPAQVEMEKRVKDYPSDLDPAASGTDPRVRLGFTFNPDVEVITEYALLAARFCEPALDPKFERIQPDAQGFLIAYLQPAQHDWLTKFIALQGDPALAWIAEVNAHIYTVPEGALVKMNLQGSATLLADTAAIQTMRDTLVARGAEAVVSPKISFFPNQSSNISVLNEVAYIKNYELQIIEPGSVEIADPIVDVIKEGQVMNIRALQVGEELYGLEIESLISEIERPIPTKKFKLSPLHPNEVEVGMPQVRTATVNATVRLADRAGVLLIASGLTQGRDLAIVLTFRRGDASRVVGYELGDF
jgi:hypothetical protein